MSEIRKLVVGDTTETIIRILFDHRISQESNNDAFNRANRALKIKDLKSQIMGFVKRNPNSTFELVAPEFKSEKLIKIRFTNFDDCNYDTEENDDISNYQIVVEDNFVNADIVKKVKIGKDIVLRIKAE
jgi:hypothetical protein